jgi:hypothetical protein
VNSDSSDNVAAASNIINHWMSEQYSDSQLGKGTAQSKARNDRLQTSRKINH